jgi:hypothetical protein
MTASFVVSVVYAMTVPTSIINIIVPGMLAKITNYVPKICNTFYCPLFVTGLSRANFENKDVTFHQHITHEHNVWHYLSFVVHLKTKDTTEFTGPESYVFERIEPSFQVSL